MTTILEIKTAHPEDARANTSVFAESFAEHEPLYTAEAFAATTLNESVIKNRCHEGEMWIAVLEEKIVGTVSGVPGNQYLYTFAAGSVKSFLTRLQRFAEFQIQSINGNFQEQKDDN